MQLLTKKQQNKHEHNLCDSFFQTFIHNFEITAFSNLNAHLFYTGGIIIHIKYNR